MRKIWCICFLFLIMGFAVSQEDAAPPAEAPAEMPAEDFRGSIPVELLRPARGEAPRYPMDTVIGKMGQGESSDAAFSFANWVAGGLISGRMAHPALELINPVLRESYLSTIGNIDPREYRIGGGREEADGSTSFLVRFIGREYGITAEMYVKHVYMQIPQEAPVDPLPEILEENTINNEENLFEETEEIDIIDDNSNAEEAVIEPAIVYSTVGNWTLEDLILDEARSREQEQKAQAYRMDYTPYERFF